MKLSEVTSFPVLIRLNKKNPWGKAVKVNNYILSIENDLKISNKKELEKLQPVEKYISIEVVEQEVKVIEQPKKARKKKTEN